MVIRIKKFSLTLKLIGNLMEIKFKKIKINLNLKKIKIHK